MKAWGPRVVGGTRVLGEDRMAQQGSDNVVLSVVLVSFNTRELTLRCLENLFSLELPANTEVWVVDNASWDGSPQAISQAFPQVRVLCNERNLGFARAANMALRACGGEYALLLNTDCFPEKGAIEELLRILEERPQAGIAAGALVHPDGRAQNSFGRAPTLSTELFPKALLQVLWPSRFPSKRRPPEGPAEVESVVGAFLMARRRAWERVGLMDEGYFLFMEETDWCVRMRKAGWSVLHVPMARAVHLQGQSAAGDGVSARLEFYRSRYRFFTIHRGAWAGRALRAGLLLKAACNWACSGVLGLMPWPGARAWRQRHRLDRGILSWHLRGCPEGWGLGRV